MTTLDPFGLVLIVTLWAVVAFGLWMQRTRSPLPFICCPSSVIIETASKPGDK